MPFAVSWRIAINSLATTVALALNSAHGATPTPPRDPSSVQVPHFGKGEVKSCVPRARKRIKAVMDGDSTMRFDDQPRGSNSPCK
jgi:hypothetical protein